MWWRSGGWPSASKLVRVAFPLGRVAVITAGAANLALIVVARRGRVRRWVPLRE
jgi:hypothetical protein